jgi:hypothetical protein
MPTTGRLPAVLLRLTFLPSDVARTKERGSQSMLRNDATVLASGVLVFLASFLPRYGVSFPGTAEAGVTGTTNAWHGLAGLGLILLLLSLVVAAAVPFFGEEVPRLGVNLAAAALACVGAALVLIRSFSLPSVNVPGASVGLKWGGWVLIVLVVVQALLTVLRVTRPPAQKADDGPVVPDVPSA